MLAGFLRTGSPNSGQTPGLAKPLTGRHLSNTSSAVIIRSTSYPRAGLIGNPSDGYFGKTISFIVKNFEAEVVLYETPELEILPAKRDHSTFDGIGALAQDVKQFGYYGGLRLLKASIKSFYDYCQEQDIVLHERNFTIRYKSNVPSQVGMAGSSAIITACFRALMSFYGVTIPKPILPSLVLSVENDELKIPAGLQDRVIQALRGDGLHGLRARALWRSRGTGTTRRSIRVYCRRSTSPTRRSFPRGRKFSTTTSAAGSIVVRKMWSMRWTSGRI